MARAPVLTFTTSGIYCPDGDFHIDPSRPVRRALVTHGHSDHARAGHKSCLASWAAAPAIRHRLPRLPVETLPWASPLRIGGVTVSFHPAGHIPGSAQIRVERDGEVWVVSGDYKTEADGLAEPFGPIACHAFVTECTFGLPVFQWAPQAETLAEINAWWAANAASGRTSVLTAYSLGKAQRLIASVDAGIGPILTHPTVEAMTGVLRAQGYAIPRTVEMGAGINAQSHPGALLISPPIAASDAFADRLGQYETAFVSGWMRLGRRRGASKGFALSDHADWPGLNQAIRETGAERVFVMHGYTAAFCRWLAEQGYDASIGDHAALDGRTLTSFDEEPQA